MSAGERVSVTTRFMHAHRPPSQPAQPQPAQPQPAQPQPAQPQPAQPQPAQPQPAQPQPAHTSLDVECNMTTRQYRTLYNEVGAPWLWYERSCLPDDSLSSLIHAPSVTILLLHHEKEIAGFAELREEPQPEIKQPKLQLLYFGLRPRYIGKGLGHYFLQQTMRHAFGAGATGIWVHTCSLDHRRAISTYRACGFSTYKVETGWVTIPRSALERKRLAAATFG